MEGVFNILRICEWERTTRTHAPCFVAQTHNMECSDDDARISERAKRVKRGKYTWKTKYLGRSSIYPEG